MLFIINPRQQLVFVVIWIPNFLFNSWDFNGVTRTHIITSTIKTWFHITLKRYDTCRCLRTNRKLMPKATNFWMILVLEGLQRVDSRTKANVGWPDLALASTMYFPKYPVPPMIRTLLFASIGICLSAGNIILQRERESRWQFEFESNIWE